MQIAIEVVGPSAQRVYLSARICCARRSNRRLYSTRIALFDVFSRGVVEIAGAARHDQQGLGMLCLRNEKQLKSTLTSNHQLLAIFSSPHSEVGQI